MQADDIGVAQKLFQQAEAHVQRILPVFGQAGDVIIDHVHAEGLGQARRLFADGAEPDNAECPSAQFVHPGRAVAAPVAARNAFVLVDELARDREHQQDCVFRHSDRIGAAIVADRHASRFCRRKVGLIEAGAQQLYQPKVGRALKQVRLDQPVHKPDQILRPGDGLVEFGAAGGGHHEFEAGRGHFACGYGRVRKVGNEDYSGFHAFGPGVIVDLAKVIARPDQAV